MDVRIRSTELLALLIASAAIEFLAMGRFPWRIGLDLPLIWVAYAGLHSSPSRGAIWGMIFGVVQDAVHGGLLGLNSMAKTTIGFLAGYLPRGFQVEGIVPSGVSVAVLALVDGLFLMGLSYLLPTLQGTYLWGDLVVKAIVTGAIGGILFWLYDRWKIPKKDFRHLET